MMTAPVLDTPVLSLEYPALAELAQRKQWVCWRYHWNGKDWTKKPVQPNGIGASSTNPHTWATLHECAQGALSEGYGIGYVFNRDIVGVDLDKCRDPKTGTVEPWAKEAIERLASYTELSPSGRGFHIICKGELPANGGKSGKVEAYTADRYFTMTGQHVAGTPEDIRDATEALEWLWSTYIARTAPSVPHEPVEAGDMPWDKFDALMENDDGFRKTWLHKRGDLDDQSLSSYDFSLGVRAAQVGWSDEEIAALITQHRVKWGGTDKIKRKDYLGRTVANVREIVRRHSSGGESIRAATAAVVAREDASDIAEEGQASALDELRARLGMPISRVIITGEKTAVAYWLELEDGRRVSLGDAGSVLNIANVRRAIFAAVGKIIPQAKQHVWDATVIVLQAASEREEAADSDPVQELLSILEDYCSVAAQWDGDDAEAAFALGGPLIRNGKHMISVRNFLNWCRASNTLRDLRDEDIRRRLRMAGWLGRDVFMRCAGVVKGKFYWEGTLRLTGSLTEKPNEINAVGGL